MKLFIYVITYIQHELPFNSFICRWLHDTRRWEKELRNMEVTQYIILQTFNLLFT